MIPTGSYFITGTDTGIGKTHVACRWIRQQKSEGIQIVPMKPVSAGCRVTPQGLRNDDAEQLISAAELDLPYNRVNRYAFEPAIAPHIAALETGREIEIEPLLEDFQWLQTQGQGICVEGAGGWRVPLGPRLRTADIPLKLNIPVVLVIGIRLGCLNHALLTAEAIQADGCQLAGWVANFLDPAAERALENCEYLEKALPSPLLWKINHENIGSPG